MTRLDDNNIETIIDEYKANEKFLLQYTNSSFLTIGNRAMDRENKKSDLAGLRVACIPITTGLGEISDFTKIVSLILEDCCGVNSFVTENKDIAGIQEAYEKKSDIIFMADDDTFSAFNLKKQLYVDNGEATGRGFAAALELAAGSLEGKEVLVLGAGPVGRASVDYLVERDAYVKVYDKSDRMMCNINKNPKIEFTQNWKNRSWEFIIDATNEDNIIRADNINNETICASPGIPLGIEESSQKLIKLNIHNLLEIGVVTMLSGVV